MIALPGLFDPAAGADLSHAVRLVTYVTDRTYLSPVRAAVLPA